MSDTKHLACNLASRLLAMLVLVVVTGAASECHAQLQRGWFKRVRAQQEIRQNEATHQHTNLDGRQVWRNRTPIVPHQQDSPSSRFPESLEPFPKFIGGFHSSHYTNLGIPTGDLGFRGNGIYWAPW